MPYRRSRRKYGIGRPLGSKNKGKRADGGQSNSARKLEDIAESINLLMRKDRTCADSDCRVVHKGGIRTQPYSCPLATTIVVREGGEEVWLCDAHADKAFPLLTIDRVWYDNQALYE